MAQGPGYIEIDLELTQEEHDHVATRARTVGLDLPNYTRVCALMSSDLPKPYPFLAFMERLSKFTTDYRAHLHAIDGNAPNVDEQSKNLAADFARLLGDWNALYGPR